MAVDLKTNVSSKWKIGAVSSQNTGAGHFVLLSIWTEVGFSCSKLFTMNLKWVSPRLSLCCR